MSQEDGAELLFSLGLMTEGLGPIQEWSPLPPTHHQRRHNQFWCAVGTMLPDDQDDEEQWMTQEATEALRDN